MWLFVLGMWFSGLIKREWVGMRGGLWFLYVVG